MIYILLLLILAILYVIIEIFKYSKNRRKNFLIISTLLLSILSGIRYNVGTDYNNYVVSFVNQFNYSFWDFSYISRDYGFYFIYKLIGIFTKEYSIALTIISLLTVSLISSTIYSYSKMPLFSILLYITLNFYTFSFNGVRQALAVAICVYSFRFIVDGDFRKFICCLIIASTIHFSAIVFIIAWISRDYILKGFKSYIGGMSFITAILFANNIIELLLNNFYKNYSYDSFGMSGMPIGLVILIPICIGLFIFFLKTKLYANDRNNIALVNIGIVTMLFFIYSTKISNFTRIAEYFYIFSIITIPNAVSIFKKRGDRAILITAIFSLAFIWFYLSTIRGNLHNVLPYYTIFDV
ncbi:MAG: EpsG family protein [Tissierellia bacterium]|nr:EpsG family protein [Tissierellia bacterium]